MERKIEIMDSNPQTEKLVLRYNGENGDDIEANPLDRIVWEMNDTKIYSYRIAPKSTGSDNIWHFWNTPPSQQTRSKRESAGVGLFAKGKKFHYSIFWKTSENGPELEHDPVIAIKASPGLFPQLLFGSLVGLVIGGVASLLLWRQKKILKKENQKL